MADHRHLPPGWHLQDGGYRDEAGVPDAAHAVLVPVRKHDDVDTPRPVLVTVVDSDPAGAAGDDVEQDDAVGIWPEDLRCLPRGQRLVRPWLAVLGPKEYRSFQPQPLKRRLERRRRSALVARGHAIRCAGVTVMAKCRTPHKTDRVMNNHRPPRPGKDKRWPCYGHPHDGRPGVSRAGRRSSSCRPRHPGPVWRGLPAVLASSPTRSFRSPKEAEPAPRLAQTKVARARPHHRGRARAFHRDYYSGRGSQRKRRTATPAPTTPQAASTARSRQSAPACWANGPVRASLNGRTGSQPQTWLSSAEWIGP